MKKGIQFRRCPGIKKELMIDREDKKMHHIPIATIIVCEPFETGQVEIIPYDRANMALAIQRNDRTAE